MLKLTVMLGEAKKLVNCGRTYSETFRKHKLNLVLTSRE